MAIVFRISNKAQTQVYDFQTENLKPQTRSTTPNGDGWVTETFTLVGHTTDANIMASEERIGELATLCGNFWDDDHNIVSIWLEEKATAENEKRALIQSISLVQITQANLSPTLGKVGAIYTLVIIRSEIWEDAVIDNFGSADVPCLGGVVALNAIAGDVPGRMALLELEGDAVSTGTITEIWGGIKLPYTSSADFDPLIECETATLGAGVVLASHGDAHGGGGANNTVEYDTAVTDFMMLGVTLDDAFASVNYKHWQGDYKVLLRCKANSTNPIRLHLNWGYQGSSIANVGPDVYIASSFYKLYDMGNVRFPPFPRLDANLYLKQTQLQLYAQRLGAGVIFYADCFLLIPAKHSFYISNCKVVDNLTSRVYCYINEDGSVAAVNIDAAGIVDLAAVYSPNDFVYPIGGGKLIIAAQQATVQDLADLLNVGVSNYTRSSNHAE